MLTFLANISLAIILMPISDYYYEFFYLTLKSIEIYFRLFRLLSIIVFFIFLTPIFIYNPSLLL